MRTRILKGCECKHKFTHLVPAIIVVVGVAAAVAPAPARCRVARCPLCAFAAKTSLILAGAAAAARQHVRILLQEFGQRALEGDVAFGAAPACAAAAAPASTTATAPCKLLVAVGGATGITKLVCELVRALAAAAHCAFGLCFALL